MKNIVLRIFNRTTWDGRDGELRVASTDPYKTAPELAAWLRSRLHEDYDVSYTIEPSLTLSADVRNLILNGELIAAIKMHRQESCLGLKEAKDAVEDWRKANVPSYELTQLREQTTNQSFAIANMRTQINALNNDMTALVEHNETQLKKIGELQDQIANLQEKNDNQRVIIEQLSQEDNKTLCSTIDYLKNELATRTKANALFHALNEQLRAKISDAKEALS